MKLSEIHTAITSEQQLSEGKAFATLVAIEHLAQVEGVPVSALDFSAPLFGAKYASQQADLHGFWTGRSQYLAWRGLILNAQMRFAPGDVDADPWQSLSRAERLQKNGGNSALYNLRKFLSPETLPKDVTDVLLVNIRREMPSQVPVQFRAGVNVFRNLFKNDLALRSGLLPDKCPDPFPGLRNHGAANMSPALKKWRDSLPARSTVVALNYLNRLAVMGGRLNGKTDTLDDLRAAIRDLPDPEEAKLPSITVGTLRAYKERLQVALNGPKPRKTNPQPTKPSGVQRHAQPRKPTPVPPKDPVETAWDDLYAYLRKQGWKSERFRGLSYLRRHARAAGVPPRYLSQDFVDTLRRQVTKRGDRTNLRAAVRDIASLSHDPALKGLPILSPPEDQRFTQGGLTRKIRAELEELLDFMNPAPSTRRAFRLSVGVLTDAMGRPKLSLEELLRADIKEFDLGPHEPRRKTHSDNIRKLQTFIELPWTSAWQQLQQVVAATGMRALANPVPKVLSWNPGKAPNCVSKEWAQRLDRELRSTLRNPPHGRADLALTLAGHIEAFDALHDIPEVTDTALLPPRIGRIRK
ncbi:hypothetical protein [Roseovarius sp. ZX-A-9]|uniref:hypothetical protein n=1 Tax=Roseovarius sp. ZX-A-9 TaxID=3014783 RepID=UPI00232ABF91|nr:hypothetical protein [Roseovarius sp. ZX-A-9]